MIKTRPSKTVASTEKRPAALIFGIEGPVLSAKERSFFKKCDPLGYILFRRNCQNKGQIQDLVADLKSLSNRAIVPILIDEEGGRVTRLPLRAPFPPAGSFGIQYDLDSTKAIQACFESYRALGAVLHEFNLDVDCAPILDMTVPQVTTLAIGDRSFGSNASKVIELGIAAIKGLLAAGVVPIIKHVPGYGFAHLDPHSSLPVVSKNPQEMAAHVGIFRSVITSFPRPSPFWAMTAHVQYLAWDKEHPATLSGSVVQEIIRQDIGFKGVLISDDLFMKALPGSPADRVKQCLAAGLDVALYCHGDIAEKKEAAQGANLLSESSWQAVKAAWPLR